MNTNAWILLGALLGLLMELPLGIKVMQNRTSEQKKVYISAMLAVLSGVLIGGGSVAWRMTRPSSYVPEQSPLPEQSQVIIHEWDGTYQPGRTGDTFASLSGRDGMVHWSYQRRPSGFFTSEDGVVYERGVLLDNKAVMLAATRLTDGRELWSTTIKSASPAPTLPTNKIVVVQGKLYVLVDETMYVLSTRDGKILSMIKPALSGYDDAIVTHFAVNDEVAIIEYNVAQGDESPTTVFVCLRLSDGSVLWKSERGLYHDLIALQGSLFYAQGKGIVALRVRDGSEVWRANLRQVSIVVSSASSERVYLRAQSELGSGNSTVYALDAHTGQLLWTVPVDTWSGDAPVEVDGITYITDTNTFSAYQASTGQLVWQYKEEPFSNTAIAFNPYDVVYFSQPAIVDGVVFVSNIFTTSFPPPFRLLPDFCIGQCRPVTGIYALRVSDGKILWRRQTESNVEFLATSIS